MPQIFEQDKRPENSDRTPTDFSTLKPKVFVALSGGVDSSVAAALLLRAGYDVYGVYMKEWIPSGIVCKAGDDRQMAARAAACLNIPFSVWDFSDAYEKKVAEYMIREYKEGQTPNPDVMCNKEIKFGLFLRRALETGADYIATGHYVQSEQAYSISHRFQKHKIVCSKLKMSKDANKDQSYFLWTLTQEQLRHCLFPVGGYTKPEVRALAQKYKLPNWDRKDSQGVCFTGQFDFGEFLRREIPKREGAVVVSDGREIGRHDGVEFSTIGQRHNTFQISNLKFQNYGNTQPLYVAGKDVDANILTVVSEDDSMLYKKEIFVRNINWISGKEPHMPLKCFMRIRYRQPLQSATTYKMSHSQYKIQYDVPQRAVATGQSAVWYAADGEMLGGGIIV